MGGWKLDLVSGTSNRTLRHDQIFGHAKPLAKWNTEIFLQHVVPEDRALVRSAIDASPKTRRLDLECRIKRAEDGKLRWIAVRGKPNLVESGRLMAVIGVIMDTTERYEAQ